MSEFHFLRPWWLVALIPVALLSWRLWSAADQARPWRGVIAPHLLPHLLVGQEQRSRVSPLAVLIFAWLATVIALAGPAWQREPAPFADDTAALVVVLKVTSSMQTEDIQPTRLARSVQKIHDLLALRPGAKTALVAYSGSAHRVMPLTTDAGILDSFAGELSPEIFPSEGDAASNALLLANQIITRSGQRGWVLWMADGVAPDQLAVFNLKQRREGLNDKSRPPVSILAVAGEGSELDSLSTAARTIDANLVRVTPDDSDVRHLAANTRFSTAADGMSERWRDAGYYLVPLIAAVSLLWFRPGWVAQAGGVA